MIISTHLDLSSVLPVIYVSPCTLFDVSFWTDTVPLGTISTLLSYSR